jgi:hypothetical protein
MLFVPTTILLISSQKMVSGFQTMCSLITDKDEQEYAEQIILDFSELSTTTKLRSGGWSRLSSSLPGKGIPRSLPNEEYDSPY